MLYFLSVPITFEGFQLSWSGLNILNDNNKMGKRRIGVGYVCCIENDPLRIQCGGVCACVEVEGEEDECVVLGYLEWVYLV